jgi:hypothetical protein
MPARVAQARDWLAMYSCNLLRLVCSFLRQDTVIASISSGREIVFRMVLLLVLRCILHDTKFVPLFLRAASRVQQDIPFSRRMRHEIP